MLKVNLLVVFRTIFLKFTQKRDLASSTSERAERRLRKPSKPSIVYTGEASIASERGKRSLRKSSKPSIELRQPSAVFASKAQSEQIKHVSCDGRFSKICKSSMFRASEASFASLAQPSRAKRSLSKSSISRMFRASEASFASLAQSSQTC